MKRTNPDIADSVPSLVREMPNLFAYVDYREFLERWFEYQRLTQKGFSLRKLARDAEISSGYLNTFLAGTIELSSKALEKILPHFKFTEAQKSYLRLIRLVSVASTQSERISAIKKLNKFDEYRELNTAEVETVQYMKSWLNVAIREMSNWPSFVPKSEWIKKQLMPRVSSAEVSRSLQFLFGKSYLEKNEQGQVKQGKEKRLKCAGSIHRVALAQFHHQMLDLAKDSIDQVVSAERSLVSYTLSLSEAQFVAVKAILDEALAKVAALESDEKDVDRIYHVELCAFPIAKKTSK